MMAKTPQVGLAKLAALRSRERLFHVAWGLVRWLSVALVVFAVATFIDWRVDKYRETPLWLRVPLTMLVLSVLAVTGWFWLIKPWAKGPSMIRLARRVEERIPAFGHRLVTAIQLTRGNARTEGMSPELLASVADEAETLSQQHSFIQFADTRLLKWAAGLIAVPCLLLTVMLAFYGPNLLFVLFQRQFLASTEIPRFNKLENNTPMLWPAGDEVVVEYIVSGRIDESAPGRVRVKPDDLPADEYELTFTRRLDADRTVFAGKVPHSSVNFTHRAWVGDGRTKSASEVKFEPRPVVTRTDAWVQLPKFLGAKPDGKPYETYQSQGEIIGLAGSTIRLKIGSQKPLSEAKVILLARTPDGSSEMELPSILMFTSDQEEELFTGEKQFTATTTFELRSDLLAYRIEVKDRNGFGNSTPPRRGIQILPDEPPTVRLLPERYSEPGTKASEEDIIEGLPIPLGGQIPVAYFCRSPQGVGKAIFWYRVNEKGPWVPLPLRQVDGGQKTGHFDSNIGTFVNAGYGEQVEFHAAPSLDPETMPDYLTGGGRFDFQTAELTKITDDNKTGKVDVGDRIEFYLEVFDRNPTPGRKPGRSEIRLKEILSATEVLLRLDQTRQAEGKIRELEKKQQDVFGKRP